MNSKYCPSCGQPLIPPEGPLNSTVNLNFNTLYVAKNSTDETILKIKLSPSEAELLNTILLAWPKVATVDKIMSDLYGGGEQANIDTMRVFIRNIRKKLTSTDLWIDSEWGVGYFATIREGKAESLEQETEK